MKNIPTYVMDSIKEVYDMLKEKYDDDAVAVSEMANCQNVHRILKEWAEDFHVEECQKTVDWLIENNSDGSCYNKAVFIARTRKFVHIHM